VASEWYFPSPGYSSVRYTRANGSASASQSGTGVSGFFDPEYAFSRIKTFRHSDLGWQYACGDVLSTWLKP
jgi:hypothetical protein